MILKKCFRSDCPVKTGAKMFPGLDLDPFQLSLRSTLERRADKYGEWLREIVPDGL